MLDSVLLSFRKRSKIDLDQQMLFFFHFEYQDRRTSALTRSKKLLGTRSTQLVADLLSFPILGLLKHGHLPKRHLGMASMRWPHNGFQMEQLASTVQLNGLLDKKNKGDYC